jgi:hypothetical protein
VLVIASNTGLGGVSNNTDIPVQTNAIESQNVSKKAMKPSLEEGIVKTQNSPKPGYYILNTNETIKHGVPKYIYLGPEAPNLVYQNTESES